MITKITKDISKVVEQLKAGNIAAVPTETVYGLASSALNDKAVRKIYKAKSRPTFNPLIVHVAKIEDINNFAKHIPETGKLLLEKFSPGPITLVLKKKNIIPDIVTAGKDTVAIRVPDHDMMRELISLCGFPICAPSANISGRISPTSAMEVKKELEGKIEYILDGGKCKYGLESTVVTFKRNVPVILRHGAITQEQIELLCGKVITNTGSEIHSPGMLKDHYAPKTTMLIFDGDFTELKKSNKKFAVLKKHTNQSIEKFAVGLFSTLRKLDEGKFDFILTSFVEDKGIGRAVNERLIKAAKGFLSFENGKIKIVKK